MTFLALKDTHKSADRGPKDEDNDVMVFENNWVFPWADSMYDPVLKIILRPWHGPNWEPGDVSFSALYDPEMLPGIYSRLKTQEEREWYQRYSPRTVDDAVPVESKSTRNILGRNSPFQMKGEVVENVLRIKYMQTFWEVLNFDSSRILQKIKNDLDSITSENIPIISMFPKEFLHYSLENYIFLPDLLRQANFPVEKTAKIQRIELCVLSFVITDIFHLDLIYYSEVEPDWRCFAVRELSQ